MRPMSSAPREGTVLLCFRPRLFDFKSRDYEPQQSKWEECRYFAQPDVTGAKGHWEPWSGDPGTRKTEYISEEDCLGWLPRPEETLE